MTAQPITVIASLRVLPGHETAALGAIRQCVALSRQEATNLSYQCHRDINDPAIFVFVERWTSPEALAAHEETPHFQAMKAAFATALAAPLQVHITREL
ncbi:antibiotic biosynthesis monooxygenase [Komagataeibacter xylinus]|uniref:Antibiotic biosynthesis monooxygenase n=1 Tax=Komagataeibacter xylinus TaxID=28448 RepID=A0A318PRR9_KOMXY|nr:putative quinol monooxygenase [Komagataeibacter xylinus]AZV40398.1 antibiotic biosynthesis monooxygenase [Komagataeibacter xylinus]PYD57987.1 antibiotic biosynthesis monooxygenase [Komagataeibacter xylinus]GBQ73768.1 antibiotic biosynthesis monooxygenase [Komagataeibacter xylinus NBRC 15237]